VNCTTHMQYNSNIVAISRADLEQLEQWYVSYDVKYIRLSSNLYLILNLTKEIGILLRLKFDAVITPTTHSIFDCDIVIKGYRETDMIYYVSHGRVSSHDKTMALLNWVKSFSET